MERCIKRTPRRLAGAIRDRGRSGLDSLGKVYFDYSQIFAGLYESYEDAHVADSISCITPSS